MGTNGAKSTIQAVLQYVKFANEQESFHAGMGTDMYKPRD